MIEIADFEMGIVGRPVWRVVSTVDADQLSSELANCSGHVIVKVSGNDFDGINRLLRLGFCYSGASTRLTLPLSSLVSASDEAGFAPLTEADMEAAAAISDHAFGTRNRFADDPFLGQFAKDIHRQWLVNSLKGYAQRCLKVTHLGRLGGFATLHTTPPRASIGLIAVDANLRGKGLGRRLMARLIMYARDAGCTDIDVVTESENCAALDFYTRLGFRHRGSELALHRMALPARS